MKSVIVLFAIFAMMAQSVRAVLGADGEAGIVLPELAFAVMVGRSEVEIQRCTERTGSGSIKSGNAGPRPQPVVQETPSFQPGRLLETHFHRAPLETISAKQIDGRDVPASVLVDRLSKKTAVIFLSDVRAEFDRSCLGVFKPDTLILQIKSRGGPTIAPLPEGLHPEPRRASGLENAVDQGISDTRLEEKEERNAELRSPTVPGGKPGKKRPQRVKSTFSPDKRK